MRKIQAEESGLLEAFVKGSMDLLAFYDRTAKMFRLSEDVLRLKWALEDMLGRLHTKSLAELDAEAEAKEGGKDG